jgi:HD-like signal output (HDOD) protein
MLRALKALFGARPEKPRTVPTQQARQPAESPAPSVPAAPEAGAAGGQPEEACEFYRSLVEQTEHQDLQGFGPDDRLFISAVLKKLREGRLEIPLLPRAALEISKLLSDPSSGAGDFSKVLEADPALSVDVLRISNSAFYGFGKTTDNVRDAVVRIGLNQLRGLVIVTHLNGKVLRGGCFKRESAWLSDLSLSLAHLAQYLATPLGIRADGAFAQGMLMHVEHFVIMGAANEIAREQQRRVEPTARGLQEAILRCGEAVRKMAARQWGLESVLLEGDGDGLRERFEEMRRALIADWTGEPVGALSQLPPEALTRALKRVRGAGLAAAGLEG